MGKSLKDQGSQNKNQQSLVRKRYDKAPATLEQQQSKPDEITKPADTMVNRLDQQRTVEDSKIRVAKTKTSKDNNQPSLAAQDTLDNRRSKISSGNREVNRSSVPVKTKREKSNSSSNSPEIKGSLASNQNPRSSQTKKENESEYLRSYKALEIGFKNRSKIRIQRRETDGKMRKFSHMDIRVTQLSEVTSGSATIELVIEEPDKSPAKFLLKWRVFDDNHVQSLIGGQGYVNDSILVDWRKKQLKKYIYDFIEKLREEGEK